MNSQWEMSLDCNPNCFSKAGLELAVTPSALIMEISLMGNVTVTTTLDGKETSAMCLDVQGSLI